MLKLSRHSPPPGGWILAFQVGFAVCVTIALCIWQIGRGFEKLEDKRQYEESLALEPIDEEVWLNNPVAFRHIQLRGIVDPTRYFVIENQSHQGRPGYWIIGVLNTEHDRYLVNRGWVSVQPSLHIPPSVDPLEGTVDVLGVSWPNEILRHTQLISDPQWPVRLRELDVGQMGRLTGARAEEIRLKCCEPTVFQPVQLRMEYATAIHWGYAAQWIVIGLLVFGGYWFFTLRKDKGDK